VWPGHGAGSACGKALGNVPQTTVGYELRFNWAFAVREEDEFVRRVLDGLGEPPRYFARMKHVNQQGSAPLASLSRPQNLAPDSIDDVLATGTLVVDTRPAHTYGAGHIPGTLNIPAGPALVTWAGALLPYDQPLAFILESEQAESITTRLRLIGFDDIDGYWTPEALHAWETHGRALETVQKVDPSSLRQMIGQDAVTVLDVRERAEYQAGHIPGSVNIPLGQIERRIGELPASRPLAVHCQGGTRSAIAASLLLRQGRADILDLSAGFRRWHAEGEPVEDDALTPITAGG
jgi:hydroxyacylglutathione hydrolase